MSERDLKCLSEKLPSAVVARTQICSFTGGLYSEKYLANLDCQGEGPTGRISLERKVIYPVMELVEWLARQVKEH
jgi:hypothetical protein